MTVWKGATWRKHGFPHWSELKASDGHSPRYAEINTSATSARVNSTGGIFPSTSSSRTFVPDRTTRSPSTCGHDFVDAIEPQTLHQKVCSKNIGSMSSS